MTHHPWREVRALKDWTVHWTCNLPEGIDAATHWEDCTIMVRVGLSQVLCRCIIEHERQHILRGPGGHIGREERFGDVAATHALIRLDDLVSAAKWARSMPELADGLNVTEDVGHVRLRHLHRSERVVLRRAALEAAEEEEAAG